MTLSEAREHLRIDGTDNDEIIQSLLDAIPSYIEVATGLSEEKQASEPLANTVGKFLLIQWYNAERSESDKIQRTIDNLLKSLQLIAGRK